MLLLLILETFPLKFVQNWLVAAEILLTFSFWVGSGQRMLSVILGGVLFSCGFDNFPQI